MDRSALKSSLRAVLGLSSDDPLASDAVLNPVINQAYQQVVAAIGRAAPDALSDTATVTLTNGAGPSPDDLFQIRAVRDTDADGAVLTGGRVPYDELQWATNAYAITGVEPPYTITVTDDVTAATIWLAYTRGTTGTALAADTDTPDLVPTAFHDVIYLQAAFAMALGGEQQVPEAIQRQATDRLAQMLAQLVRVGGPGGTSRTRLTAQGAWP